jgi:hypothetical protein
LFHPIHSRQLVTTGKLQRYRHSAHFTVPRYAPTRILQSSLAVSWQRIYHSLTVTSNHTGSLLSQPYSFLPIVLQQKTQETRLNLIPMLPSSYPGRMASRNPIPHSRLTVSFITHRHGPRRKQPLLLSRSVSSDVA